MEFTVSTVNPLTSLSIRWSNGVPAAGAGNIETIDDIDIYRLNVNKANSNLYVTFYAGTDGLAYQDFVLLDSAGNELSNSCFGCGEPGLINFPQVGTYTIRFGGTDVTMGTYSFAVLSKAP
ncbi:MAG: hypothetical protein R2880_10735 [Deinococcales bacterium]